MAAANDVEDFVTCGVCFCEYDDVGKKPKFLQCSHTVCLSCLKGIRDGDTITCPFCRDTFVKFDVESLPNNPYALHMLKFKEKKEPPKPVEIPIAPVEVHWCLTCGSAEKLGCSSSGHSSVNMTINTIKNLESLLKLKEELLAMKDSGTNKLAMAIQERQKVQEQLALIMKSIQCSGEEVQKLQDENNLRMTEMVSVLERNGSKTDSQDVAEKKSLFFSELMSLVDGSTADDTTETLKQKMTTLVEMHEQQLCEATAVASEYDFRRKVKITVHLYDENDQLIPTLPLLEKGFRFQPLSPALKGNPIRQDSLLLSYAVFSLLQRQKIPLNIKEPQQSAVAASNSSSTTTTAKDPKKKPKTIAKIEKEIKLTIESSPVTLPPSVFPSSSKFVLNPTSVFILRLFHTGNLYGEIRFNPVLRLPWIMELMQKLGDFCFQSQKIFCNAIDKVVPRVYVLFPITNQQFQPEIPNAIDTNKMSTYDLKADLIDEVGITLVKTSSGKVTGWSFVFPLEEFRNPKNEIHVKKLLANDLFGRVISHNMLESVTKLSLTNKLERTNYTVTIESQ
ncbi:uncharacterized protein LOC124196775 [Daphnia pulex]|uniref:uncharacterized protein LOC124196775 n=1 Tax=Daphnia pulex TaxID=6669 RepID=UPI001EDE6FCE|nr:uncharacterized protein LOC124196775 [Daphnia pulex]